MSKGKTGKTSWYATAIIKTPQKSSFLSSKIKESFIKDRIKRNRGRGRGKQKYPVLVLVPSISCLRFLFCYMLFCGWIYGEGYFLVWVEFQYLQMFSLLTCFSAYSVHSIAVNVNTQNIVSLQVCLFLCYQRDFFLSRAIYISLISTRLFDMSRALDLNRSPQAIFRFVILWQKIILCMTGWFWIYCDESSKLYFYSPKSTFSLPQE